MTVPFTDGRGERDLWTLVISGFALGVVSASTVSAALALPAFWPAMLVPLCIGAFGIVVLGLQVRGLIRKILNQTTFHD